MGSRVGIGREWAGRNGEGGTGFTSRFSHSPLETDVPLFQLTIGARILEFLAILIKLH